ncbi:hypothetical protein [Photobacterium sp. J15]|uniref:hypothetical protein n=1 Tax=Photobacterium sp. J15 TaxID=265901 RepID=UPI0007E48524|nr:hypothetical protein [Photobacterium sp. J15]
MDANFDVNGKEFRVSFSFLGFEKYYFDGKLLKKRWNIKRKDRLTFVVDGETVEIVVFISTKDISTQAYVNGQLVVEELFPEFKEKIALKNRSKPSNVSVMIKQFILWFILALIFMSVYQTFISQP